MEGVFARVLIPALATITLLAGCASDANSTAVPESPPAQRAPVQSASPVRIESLLSLNGRSVAANLGEAPEPTGVEIVVDEAGKARVLEAVAGLQEPAEERVRSVDMSRSILIVAHDEICRAAGPGFLEIAAETVTVVLRDVGFGCTSAGYHYTVFELPYTFGFDDEHPPSVDIRIEGLDD